MLPNGNCQYNKQTTDDGVSQMHHSTHIKTAIIFIKKKIRNVHIHDLSQLLCYLHFLDMLFLRIFTQ